MKKFMLASVAIVAASSAFAGGYVAPVEQPVIAPIVTAPVEDPSDWTGFYAGLQYGQGNAELKGAGNSADEDFDAYGVHAGYNHDMGKWVLGGELDYNKLDFDQSEGDGDLVRLRGRAGYDMGKLLPYATLGVAHISADDVGADLSETGITYGLGVEYKATEKFSVGLEYSRNDFSDVDEDNLGKGIDLDSDLVQVRASYRF